MVHCPNGQAIDALSFRRKHVSLQPIFINALSPPKPDSDRPRFCGSTSGLLVTREHRGGVELVRSSNDCIGDFESTDFESADLESTKEAFCRPDFRVTHLGTLHRSAVNDPPFAKLIRGNWVC
jgi:hypothetical protein